MQTPASTRRTFLRSAAVGVAGSALLQSVPERAGADTAEWSSFHYGAGNRGYTPDGAGPVERFRTRWQFATRNRVDGAAPVVTDGVLYVGSHDRSLYALDLDNGTELWSYDTGDRVDAPAAVADGTVVVANGAGVAVGLDAETGAERWSKEGPGHRHAPVIDDGVVYFSSSRGPVGRDLATGEQVWRRDANEPGTAGPAYRQGTVYYCSEFTLSAIDAGTGDVDWRFEAGGRIESVPTLHDSTVYVGADNGRVYAVDTDGGAQRWVYNTGAAEVSTSPAVDGDRVYVASVGGATYALDPADGSELWRFEYGSHNSNGPSPVVTDEVVYVSFLEDLYAVDPASGTEIDSVEVPDRIEATPCVVGDSIYLGARDGVVYGYTTDLGKGPPSFELSDLDPERPRIREGESVTISVTVTNVGGETAATGVVFRINGNDIQTQDIELAGGESTVVSFTHTPDRIGGFEFTVATDDDELEGLLAIEPDTDGATGPGGTDTASPADGAGRATSESGPGFGVTGALAGFGSAAYALRRRVADDEDA